MDTLLTDDLFARLGLPARMRQLARYDLFAPELPARLDAVAAHTARRLGAPISLVSIVLDSAQLILGSHGIGGWIAEVRGTPAEWSLCSRTVLNGSTYRVTDAGLDPVHAGNPLVARTGLRSYAGVPLKDRSKYSLGAHCAVDVAGRAFSDDDIVVLDRGAREIVRILAEHRYSA